MKYTFELNEETHEVPGKYCVCPECEGTGYTLCDGMKGHAYTQEEFDEAFDEEAKEQYFTRGGIYDQPCKTCKGKNVVMVPNVAACNEEQNGAHDGGMIKKGASPFLFFMVAYILNKAKCMPRKFLSIKEIKSKV